MEQSREVGLNGEIEEPLERGGLKAVKLAEGAKGGWDMKAQLRDLERKGRHDSKRNVGADGLSARRSVL